MNGRAERGPTRAEPASAGSLAALTALVTVVAVLVVTTWYYTHERIAEYELRRTQAEISTVLPASLYDNEPARDRILLDTGSGRLMPVYRARWNGAPMGAVLTVIAPDGFVGPIRLLVGISAEGRVLGVQVAAHSETPGIGDAIEQGKSAWLRVFNGRSLADPPESLWSVRADGGEFDAIAGATVSSRSVVGGVHHAVQYFATHRNEIFARLTDEVPNGRQTRP